MTIQFHRVFDPVNMLHCVPTPPSSPYMYVRYLFSSGTRTQFAGVLLATYGFARFFLTKIPHGGELASSTRYLTALL